MKKNLLLRKLPFLCVFLLLMWLPYSSYAQAVKRQCISSYGSIAVFNNILAGQTAGQSYFTQAFTPDKTIVLQGFQQPVSFADNNSAAVFSVNKCFSIYPNPANHSFRIQSGEEINNVTVLISDINGKIILSEEIPRFKDHEIISEPWESGFYFITLCSGDRNKQTQKIIILK